MNSSQPKPHRIQCSVCLKLITRTNIARHRASHGKSACQRCLTNNVAPVCPCIVRQDAVTTMGIHYFFQSFQWELLATEISNLMMDMIGYCSDYSKMNDISMEGYYEAALYDLEYTWLWTD